MERVSIKVDCTDAENKKRRLKASFFICYISLIPQFEMAIGIPKPTINDFAKSGKLFISIAKVIFPTSEDEATKHVFMFSCFHVLVDLVRIERTTTRI